MTEKSGVKRAIEAAAQEAILEDPGSAGKSAKQVLADRWGISYQAVDKFDRQGYFPVERAKAASREFGIPLRDLVRSDIRGALDSQQG